MPWITIREGMAEEKMELAPATTIVEMARRAEM
jgi:hypothetical protein